MYSFKKRIVRWFFVIFNNNNVRHNALYYTYIKKILRKKNVYSKKVLPSFAVALKVPVIDPDYEAQTFDL